LIVGPTAVGKTEIAIELAERVHGEIVSADSRLFYRGMDIGTAKPTPEQQARIPHHLIDIADPDETLSLRVFQQKAQAAIADIQARGKIALLVGGTGQYVRAVTQGWAPPEVQPDPRLRAVLEQMKEEAGELWLHDRLAKLDPLAAQQIDARNVRRTIRALEVIFSTGRRFSDQRGQTESPYRLVALGLWRPRPELYARLDARIEAMFAAGLLDEVAGLRARGYSTALPSMSAIGYREGAQVLEGRMDLEQAKQAVRRATRVFVRRQANWFKPDDPQIKWFQVRAGIVPEIETWLRSSVDF
jgi:tRNA dimethylallyltransferase